MHVDGNACAGSSINDRSTNPNSHIAPEGLEAVVKNAAQAELDKDARASDGRKDRASDMSKTHPEAIE